MHYVICYDLESDRLRGKVAKALQKHGCNRVQKSVFVAADMSAKHLERLSSALKKLLASGTAAAQDSVLVIPLPEEYARLSMAFGGLNSILAETQPLPSKILL